MTAKKTTRRKPLTFADVRKIALAMPEVTEVTAYGMPAFKAGKKRFAGQPTPRADVEPNTLGVFMRLEERDRLLEERPSVYYLTDHFANYPAVLVRLGEISRAELREILSAAWQAVMEAPGPKKRSSRTRRLSPIIKG